jgi:hypothetical protein
MQFHLDPPKHLFLTDAVVQIPPGWYGLVDELFMKLSVLDLPMTFRIAEIRRQAQYMFVDFDFSQLEAFAVDKADALVHMIDEYSRRAGRTCMTCGGTGRTLFRRNGWGTYCEQHAPADAKDLHSRYKNLPAHGIDSKALHAAYPELPSFQCRSGWLPLIERLMQELYVAGFDKELYRVTQIKEKFASLRFYIHSTEPDSARQRLIHALIDVACEVSCGICEVCGRGGTLWIDGGYWTTVCPAHVPKGAKTPVEHFGKSG